PEKMLAPVARNPFAARSIPAEAPKALSNFAFHALFDDALPSPDKKPAFGGYSSHDVDDVIAHISRDVLGAQIQRTESSGLLRQDEMRPSSILTFSFRGSPVRALRDEARQPWFSASDVARLLGFSHAYASGLVFDAEKCSRQVTIFGVPRTMDLVNESGLNTLITRSRRKGRKPYTQEFRTWIAEQVIPALPLPESDIAEHHNSTRSSSCSGIDGVAVSKAECARFVLDLSDPDKPSVAPLPDPVSIDLDSDAWIEKAFATASQSQLKKVLRAVAARLV
ncbi:MAG: BRO-N domain-containing protein, partial [Acidobacteriaceae bacterium]